MPRAPATWARRTQMRRRCATLSRFIPGREEATFGLPWATMPMSTARIRSSRRRSSIPTLSWCPRRQEPPTTIRPRSELSITMFWVIAGPGSGSGGGERPTPKVRFGVRRGRHEGRRAGMGALSVQPHPVRDDCNHSGQSDPGPLGARALGDPHAPSLQGRPPLHPG